MSPELSNAPVVLLTGASGYVGGRLIPLLEQQPVVLRCLARKPDKLRPIVKEATQIVRGDVLDPPSLDEALQGVHTAYYLVHLMSGAKDFEKEDRQAATNFAQAAKKAGVRRIIYLGGLGDDADPRLSPHLRSRHEVGQILRGCGVETIEYRASLVIGTGSLSFDLVKSLTDRLGARPATAPSEYQHAVQAFRGDVLQSQIRLLRKRSSATSLMPDS